MMNIRRTPADAAFSLAVRERDNWTCQRCGARFMRGAQNLHCSHIYSRRHSVTRYEPLNAVAHCFTCHQYLGENPVEFARWAELHLGAAVLDAIGTLAHSTGKRASEKIRKAIAGHYRAEAKRMAEMWEGYQSGSGCAPRTLTPFVRLVST